MTPDQRFEAERLADWLTACGVVNTEVRATVALLREMLAEPMRCPTDGGLCGAGGYCREPQGEPAAWRDHVEQRLLTWRQRFVNRSGDQLALDDFMDKTSLDDLIDFVCDEYAQPAHGAGEKT